MERKRLGIIIGAVAIVGAVTATAGVAAMNSGDDDEPITGDDYDRSVAAALAYTRGGTVTETEIGDDGAAFEVEIERDDGSQVEVQLDADFNVIGEELDDDAGESDEDSDDD